MTTKAAEKIIDGLTQLMEGFFELRQMVREDLGATVGEEDDAETVADPDVDAEVEAAIANELRATLETILENEDFSSEELAGMISGLTEALEEVDPDVFAEEAEQGEYDEDEDEYDLDDDDDLDDLDEDDEELEDEDEEDEE